MLKLKSLLVLPLALMTLPGLYASDGAPAVDLSAAGTANCYMVTAPGAYCFRLAMGNIDEFTSEAASVRLLWSDGLGPLALRLDGRYVCFETADPMDACNALVAAVDSRGRVLWSWHLWFTEQPSQREYGGGAGIAMDRNLGATAKEFLSEGSTGLMYQWGRKDPFAPGHYDTVVSDARCGTVAYSVEHPATFICGSGPQRDWCRTADACWTDAKGIYDPCPPGWRVPAGDFWKSSAQCRVYGSDETGIIAVAGEDYAFDFYPSAGYLDWTDGVLRNEGVYGFYWSSSAQGHLAQQLYFFRTGYMNLQRATYRAYGQSVRCVHED